MSSIDDLFQTSDRAVREAYDALVGELQRFGPVMEDPKKTSIHLVRRTGFAGVHPRKAWFVLTIRTATVIDSPRVVKTEQVSKNRVHNEIKIQLVDAIDPELLGWLAVAYDLSI
jgi:hypothetical protein